MVERRTILRDDVDSRRVDFSETATGERLPSVHPGEVLRDDFLKPLGMTAHGLALALRVSAYQVAAILAGEGTVTAETALRLARHFGTSARFWLNLQKSYELDVVERANGERIRAEVTPRCWSEPRLTS